MISNQMIIFAAGLDVSQFETYPNILCSRAGQLLGSYRKLGDFRSLYRDRDNQPSYTGWEAHHIVEKQDLDRVGISAMLPSDSEQLCVLLPRAGHVARINNILRNRNPSRYSASAAELLSAYHEAYELVGNYTGVGAVAIQQELLAIVQATFRLAGVR